MLGKLRKLHFQTLANEVVVSRLEDTGVLEQTVGTLGHILLKLIFGGLLLLSIRMIRGGTPEKHRMLQRRLLNRFFQ